MIKNDLETISAAPIFRRKEFLGDQIDIGFRRITVGDRVHNSKKFGGDDKLKKLIEELNLTAISKILFRQLMPEYKNALSEFKDSFADEDEDGNRTDENLSKYEVFLRLPIFAGPDELLKLIFELSGVTPEDEEDSKKK